MPENGSSRNEEGPRGREQDPRGRPEAKIPRTPLQTFLFWFLILFALPVALVLVQKKSGDGVEELTASQFEEFLQGGLVKSAVVVSDPSTGSRLIEGKYGPNSESSRSNDDAGDREDEDGTRLTAYRVHVVYTDALDEMIRLHCPNRDAKTDTNMVSTIVVSLLPILILVGLIYLLFSRQLKAAGRGALQFGKSRARLTSPTQERVSFEDVSGIDEAKEEVQEVIDYLRDPERFQKLGGRIPRGVLMIGPPGTGKTLLARAIAGEADVPFFAISGSDFVEMFVGVGASRVRDMFEEGKRHSPCLVFIDEIDAVGRSRFSGIGGGHDEREQTLNALLVEMDGFEPNSGVIVIAATNRPDVLDPALLRPGRFDRQITVDLPDLKGRLGILTLHTKRITIAEGVTLQTIARGTPGFSGADLANLVNEAALLAARLGKAGVEMGDLEEARDKVRWGKERRSRKVDERDRRVTAFHEAGHAMVGMLCEHATPLHKITIVPRGVAYLGATMHLPEQDRYTQSKAELLDELAVLMGGRVAEELVCDDITSGAAMDIHQATGLAKKMVCQWGMSERMGPLSYGGREEHIFVGRDITRSEDYSEETAREIDQEIRRVVGEALTRGRELLTTHIDNLRLLGETLLEQETMDAAEVRELIGLAPLPPPPEDVVESTDDTEGEGEATSVGDDTASAGADVGDPEPA